MIRGRNAPFLLRSNFMIFIVNGNAWKLKFVRPSSNYLRRSDGSFTFGVTDNNLKTVFMSDNLSGYMKDKVFLHELTHVHAFEYDYSMPIEIEEIVADFLSLYGRDIVYMADSVMNNLLNMVS